MSALPPKTDIKRRVEHADAAVVPVRATRMPTPMLAIRREPFERRTKSLMDKYGLSYDQAVSRIHRSEKLSKGIV